MGRLLVDLRNEWGVQVLVLFSFSLQVFLLMFASIRRHNVTILPRFFLWLAYQLAYSTALFTLGHMAISSRSQDEQPLMAFWAPFLLGHLGGQDTISAYSFEDNRLCLRQLQTLVVQVLGVSYVLYKYTLSDDILLMVAAVLIFTVGILKYGERSRGYWRSGPPVSTASGTPLTNWMPALANPEAMSFCIMLWSEGSGWTRRPF